MNIEISALSIAILIGCSVIGATIFTGASMICETIEKLNIKKR